MTFKFKSRKFVYTHSYSLINVHAALLAAKSSLQHFLGACQALTLPKTHNRQTVTHPQHTIPFNEPKRRPSLFRICIENTQKVPQ